jgi:UDP-glucose 4-epimerase
MTTWLVTGGAGFIGSHLCEALLARGDAVRVLDDLSTGKRENLPPGAMLIEGDVADLAAVRGALDGVAGCFHLAAIASVERGVTDWLGTHAPTSPVRSPCRCGGRRGSVVMHPPPRYGDAASVPIAEAAERRRSAYGADKLAGEPYARVASHAWHTDRRAALLQCTGHGRTHAPYSGVISIFWSGPPRRADRYLRRRRADADFACRRRGRGAVGGVAPRAGGRAGGQRVHRHRDLGAGPGAHDRRTHRQAVDARHRPRAPARSATTGAPALSRAILGLADPLSLRKGLAEVLDWMGGAV